MFIGYLFINAIWAPDPAAGVLKAATVLGLTIAAFLIAGSYSLQAPEDVRVLAKCALAGLLTGAAFLLIEIVFDDAIMRFINNHIVKVMHAGHKNAQVVGGEVTEVSAFVLNRNATSMMLLLIPGALFTAALSSRAIHNGVLASVVLLIGLSILLSQSGTSTMAFFLSAFVLGVSMLSLQTARFLILTGWVLATMLAVPLAKLPYDLGWQHWTWLPPESVAARFYIWKYTADNTSAHMLTGIGIRGTRDLHLVIPLDPNDPNMGYALKGRAARHPHNVFIQTWLELGAIGAVLLLSIGLAGLCSLRNGRPCFKQAVTRYLPPAARSDFLASTCFKHGLLVRQRSPGLQWFWPSGLPMHRPLRARKVGNLFPKQRRISDGDCSAVAQAAGPRLLGARSDPRSPSVR